MKLALGEKVRDLHGAGIARATVVRQEGMLVHVPAHDLFAVRRPRFRRRNEVVDVREGLHPFKRHDFRRNDLWDVAEDAGRKAVEIRRGVTAAQELEQQLEILQP